MPVATGYLQRQEFNAIRSPCTEFLAESDLKIGPSDYWDTLVIYDDLSAFIGYLGLWLCHRDSSSSNSTSVRNQ